MSRLPIFLPRRAVPSGVSRLCEWGRPAASRQPGSVASRRCRRMARARGRPFTGCRMYRLMPSAQPVMQAAR